MLGGILRFLRIPKKSNGASNKQSETHADTKPQQTTGHAYTVKFSDAGMNLLEGSRKYLEHLSLMQTVEHMMKCMCLLLQLVKERDAKIFVCHADGSMRDFTPILVDVKDFDHDNDNESG